MKSFTTVANLAFASTIMTAAVAAPASESTAPIVHSTFSWVDWVEKRIADLNVANKSKVDVIADIAAALTAFNAGMASRMPNVHGCFRREYC